MSHQGSVVRVVVDGLVGSYLTNKLVDPLHQKGNVNPCDPKDKFFRKILTHN